MPRHRPSRGRPAAAKVFTASSSPRSRLQWRAKRTVLGGFGITRSLPVFRVRPEQAEEGRLDAARRLYQEGLDISREIGDRSQAARMLNNLGTVLWQKNDLEGARRAFEEAAQAYESLGESRYAAYALSNLGEVVPP